MSTTSVQVGFRFRNNTRGGNNAVTFHDSKNVSVMTPAMEARGERMRKYAFDCIWQGNCTQEGVYAFAGQPQVRNMFEGYNGTIFVYGQTGSGKTYTMFGPDGGCMGDKRLEGVVPRLTQEMFGKIKSRAKTHPDTKYQVLVSIVDIYLEKVRDLQNKDVVRKDSSATNLKVGYDKKTGVKIVYQAPSNRNDPPRNSPAMELEANNYEQVLQFIENALAVRKKTGAQAATGMNAFSSRSHLVVQVKLRGTSPNGITESKLLLCDLAGCEKVRNTGAQGTSLKQAQAINSGLSVLGNVLNHMTDPHLSARVKAKKAVIPFRDSNLTRILQDSLGGNCKTSLICTARPDACFVGETLSCLRFGKNAKKIKNKVFKNELMSIAQHQKRFNQMQETLAEKVERIAEQQVQNRRITKVAKILERAIQEEPSLSIEEIREKYHIGQVSQIAAPRKPNADGSSDHGLFDIPEGSDDMKSDDSHWCGGKCPNCNDSRLSQAKAELKCERYSNDIADLRMQHRALEGELDYKEGRIDDLLQMQEEWTQKSKEMNDLKMKVHTYGKRCEELNAILATHELQLAANKPSFNMDDVRRQMQEDTDVWLEDRTTVMRIIEHGDSDQHNDLVERIADQTANNHRLQELLEELRKQIGAHNHLRNHLKGQVHDMGRQFLNLKACYDTEKTVFECEQRKLTNSVDLKDQHIQHLKEYQATLEHRRDNGADAFLAKLRKGVHHTGKKKRRRHRSPVKIKIDSKLVGEQLEGMKSPATLA